MTKGTQQALESMAQYEGKTFPYDVWKGLAEKAGITFTTLKKYRLQKTSVKREMSAQEVVDLLNEMTGEDCWCEHVDWWYETENGKIYEVTKMYQWI